MIRAVVFDFDGVILESVELKGRAFRCLFRAYPQYLDAIERLHHENGGMSRFDKFRWIYRDWLRLPLTEQDLVDLDREFGAIVNEEILTCPFVPGARECVESLASRSRYRLFIASGTPEAELQSIVDLRGLCHVFAGIYGSPRTKVDILRHILEANGYATWEIVFVGDAKHDYLAAMTTGVPFIGRVPAGTASSFPEKPLACVNDLNELTAVWAAIADSVERWGATASDGRRAGADLSSSID